MKQRTKIDWKRVGPKLHMYLEHICYGEHVIREQTIVLATRYLLELEERGL